MNETPDSSDDIIDSRDVVARIDELEGERADLETEVEEAQEAYDEELARFDEADEIETHNGPDPSGELGDALAAARLALHRWEDENYDELRSLKAFADQFEDYCPDWTHGTTLIRDSYFEDYAREFAEDIGAINDDASWPNNCIDWERAARELQMDYTSGEFDGVTYWAR